MARRGRPPGTRKSLLTDPDRHSWARCIALEREGLDPARARQVESLREAFRLANEQRSDGTAILSFDPLSAPGVPARRTYRNGKKGRSHAESRLEKKMERPITPQEAM